MDNSNNEIETKSSDIIIQDPFNISNNDNSNNMMNAVPEEIKNSQSTPSNSVETFDIVNKEESSEENEESIPFVPDVDYEIAPEDMTPTAPVNQSDAEIAPQVQEIKEEIVSNPNVTEIVDTPKIDPSVLERLSIIYMGDKYEKFKKLINIPAGLFTYFYAFYRKMYLLGIILMILTLVISFLTKNILFNLIINVVMLFGFNILYVLKVKHKVTRINNKKKNKDKHPNQIADQCSISGGTSIGMMFVSFILSIIVGIVLMTLFAAVGIFNTIFGTDLKSVKDIPVVIKEVYGELTSDYIGSSDGVYRGKLVSNYDIDITKNYTMIVPMKFSNTTTTLHTYSYEYLVDSKAVCTIVFNQPKGFNNGSDLIKKIKTYDDNHLYKTSEINEILINNITWKTLTSSNDNEEIYYYGTTKNNKAYIFELSVNKNNNECLSYKDQILESINEIN